MATVERERLIDDGSERELWTANRRLEGEVRLRQYS